MGFSRQEYWSGMPSPSPVPGRGDSRYEDFEVGVCLVSLRNNKESQDGLSRESKVRELVDHGQDQIGPFGYCTEFYSE